MVSLHDGCVAGLNGRKIFILHIHVLPQLGVGRSCKKAVKDVLHIGISFIYSIVYSQHLAVMPVLVGLVENTQHLYKTVVYTAMQKRYLDNDAVVHKTLHKRVGYTLGHLHTVIIVRLVLYIENRLFYVPHPMAEQINGYHRYAIAIGIRILQDIVRIGILRTKVLAETKSLRLKPRLLKFYQHKLQASIILTDLRTEVNAEHGNLVTRTVGIFVLTHLHLSHLPLQKSRKHCLGHAVVLHEVLEHRVINWVCNTYYHNRSSLCRCKNKQ